MKQGFNGISFPFRIGVKGGVVTSTTNVREIPHIIEAMKQILLTRKGERCMEYDFYSDIDTDIFEPNDTSTHTMIAYQVKDALSRLEDRIEVQSVDISSQDSTILATVNFKVLMYDTNYSTEIKVGDMDVKNTDTRSRLY